MNNKNLILHLKPLSVNTAWQGKRFKTKAYKRYETDCTLLLPRVCGVKDTDNCFYEVDYKFYLKIFGLTYVDNLIKPLQDILVKNGFISDDHKILKIIAEKVKANLDKVEIVIKQQQ
jgi:hypothetical protein